MAVEIGLCCVLLLCLGISKRVRSMSQAVDHVVASIKRAEAQLDTISSVVVDLRMQVTALNAVNTKLQAEGSPDPALEAIASELDAKLAQVESALNPAPAPAPEPTPEPAAPVEPVAEPAN